MTNVLITGASSGIGAALARVYAQAGAHVVLWGRDAHRLADVAKGCIALGGTAETRAFDITDFALLRDALEALDAATPLDVAIFNAGIGGSLPQDRIGQEAKAAELMTGVNFTAPVIGANVIADRMAARKAGQIVFVGSVAGSFPLPMAPLYSGSKAGLALFAEALRLRLRRYGVGISVVTPGFIDTPMSQSLKEPRPFLISADKAATIIARGLRRRQRVIIVPWQFAIILGAVKFIPRFLVRAVLSAF